VERGGHRQEATGGPLGFPAPQGGPPLCGLRVASRTAERMPGQGVRHWTACRDRAPSVARGGLGRMAWLSRE
jgi:hypothetical protein